MGREIVDFLWKINLTLRRHFKGNFVYNHIIPVHSKSKKFTFKLGGDREEKKTIFLVLSVKEKFLPDQVNAPNLVHIKEALSHAVLVHYKNQNYVLTSINAHNLWSSYVTKDYITSLKLFFVVCCYG